MNDQLQQAQEDWTAKHKQNPAPEVASFGFIMALVCLIVYVIRKSSK